MVSMLLDTVATLAINHIQQIGRGWALTVHGAPIPSSTQRLISDRRARQCISSQHCFAPGTCHTFKIAGPQTTHKVSFRGKRASTQVSDVYIGLLCLPSASATKTSHPPALFPDPCMHRKKAARMFRHLICRLAAASSLVPGQTPAEAQPWMHASLPASLPILPQASICTLTVAL